MRVTEKADRVYLNDAEYVERVRRLNDGECLLEDADGAESFRAGWRAAAKSERVDSQMWADAATDYLRLLLPMFTDAEKVEFEASGELPTRDLSLATAWAEGYAAEVDAVNPYA